MGLIHGATTDNSNVVNDALAHWQILAEGMLPSILNHIQKFRNESSTPEWRFSTLRRRLDESFAIFF